MECHLGWCVSFCFGFALEPFTRGLASEDADNQTQRFVAVIVQRLVTSGASRSPIALLSRPDHNAVAPCRKVDLLALAELIEFFFGGHHVIADRSVGPPGAVKPVSPSGTERAEWLDRAEDRRTIVLVMAAVSDTRSLRRDELRDERDALVGRRAEGDDAVPS
jgi:hypothetical protein